MVIFTNEARSVISLYYLPQDLVGLVLHAYHDFALSGDHLALYTDRRELRQNYWWHNIIRDVRKWCLAGEYMYSTCLVLL